MSKFLTRCTIQGWVWFVTTLDLLAYQMHSSSSTEHPTRRMSLSATGTCSTKCPEVTPCFRLSDTIWKAGVRTFFSATSTKLANPELLLWEIVVFATATVSASVLARNMFACSHCCLFVLGVVISIGLHVHEVCV